MKTLLKITAFALFSSLIFSCGVQKRINDSRAGMIGIRDTASIKDSTEYELVVFDPGFDFWFSSHSYSKKQYSNTYLQSANNQYVLEWNRRFAAGDRRIESSIDYDYRTKYDLEFNYKLFLYFKYFEETYRTKLLSVGGR